MTPLGVVGARALGRGQPGPRAEPVGRPEATDIPDLGDDHGGGEEADARDGGEPADAWVGAEMAHDLAVGETDLAAERERQFGG
jgi:hypothetical protein